MTSRNAAVPPTKPLRLADEAGTVGEVLLLVFRYPARNLLARWNWKSSLVSSFFRGGIFFLVNLRSSLEAAAAAMALEMVFRGSTAGFYGALTQSFRSVQPARVAVLTTMFLMPAVSHTLEFVLHTFGGTARVGESVLTSALVTALTTSFNLFAMRRGFLIVGAQSRPLLEDVKSVPFLLREFLRLPFIAPETSPGKTGQDVRHSQPAREQEPSGASLGPIRPADTW